jgi:hypothetical protein
MRVMYSAFRAPTGKFNNAIAGHVDVFAHDNSAKDRQPLCWNTDNDAAGSESLPPHRATPAAFAGIAAAARSAWLNNSSCSPSSPPGLPKSLCSVQPMVRRRRRFRLRRTRPPTLTLKVRQYDCR